MNALEQSQPAGPNPGIPDVRINLDVIENILASNETRYIHSIYTKSGESLLNDSNIKAVFIYRDPRDQIVSFVYYGHVVSDDWQIMRKYSFDECMLKLIISGEFYSPWGKIGNILSFYKAFLPWAKCPNVYTTRFEDLIGIHGGGSKEKQLQELRNIAQHLEIPATDDELNKISENLFGRFSTFREGQIGTWKKHFKPSHKEAFKRIMGANQLLFDLGYEKDSNW